MQKRCKCHKYAASNLVPGQTHRTKNDSQCFQEGAQRIDGDSTKNGPSQREAGIKHVLELFICKTKIKVSFERWLLLSTNR